MQPIVMNETKQPCYDVYMYFKGIRKRCRKVEAHRVDLGKSLSLEYMHNAQGELRGSTLADLVDAAKKTIAAGYKIDGRSTQVKIHANYVKRAREILETGTAIISTEFEPFGPNHFSHTFTIEAEA